MSTQKTEEIEFICYLNRVKPKAQIECGRGWKEVPYGGWLKKHHPERFKQEFIKWKKKNG